jgi:hypothetical protein
MFDPTSRYDSLPTAKLTVTGSDGLERVVAYKRRRFLPAVGSAPTLVEHTVAQGERLDNITARYLGDPTLFWRLCDANLVLRPDELEQVGQVIEIVMPQK